MTLEMFLAHAAPTLFAAASFVSAFRSKKQIKELKIQINSRFDNLLEVKFKEGYSKGLMESKKRKRK